MLSILLALLTPITVVGVLSEDGVETCHKGDRGWAAVHPTVGWSAVYGAGIPWGMGSEIVRVTGEVIAAPTLTEATPNDMTCPPFQARSDWVRSKSGIRLRRTLQAPRYDLKAMRFQRFKGLTARFDAAADTVAVTLRNDLKQPLIDVMLVVHYEGCGGKPLSMKIARKMGRIQPGKSVTVAGLPARQHKASRRNPEHALASLQLVTQVSPILDIDVSPVALGALVKCTPR